MYIQMIEESSNKKNVRNGCHVNILTILQVYRISNETADICDSHESE